jgi:hypothetical protein
MAKNIAWQAGGVSRKVTVLGREHALGMLNACQARLRLPKIVKEAFAKKRSPILAGGERVLRSSLYLHQISASWVKKD